MITILDKGPSDKPHDTPVEVRMHSVDANQAIAADPDRYSYVKHDVIVRKPGSLEDRVLDLENRLAALEAEDEEQPAPYVQEPYKPAREPAPAPLQFPDKSREGL